MTSWRDAAACKGMDPDGFVIVSPQRGTPSRYFQAQLAAAKAVCASCPVRPDCLAHAIAQHEHGVWGGHYFRPDRHVDVAAVALYRDIA